MPNEKVEKTWKQIITLQQYVKNRLLIAEELDPKNKTWLQPLLEQRNALDHIVQCQAAVFGMKVFDMKVVAESPLKEAVAEASSPADAGEAAAVFQRAAKADYCSKNLNKALAHLYRSYFDVADWISIIIREQISETLNPYSNESIKAALPKYYSSFRPRIEEIRLDIAEIRGKKDIGGPNLISEVDEYEKQLDELTDIDRAVICAVPALQDHRKRERRNIILTAVVLPIALLFIGYLLGHLNLGKNQERPALGTTQSSPSSK